MAWLVAGKVLLPGLSVLERAVARVRLRSASHLHRGLAEGINAEARLRLDRFVTVPEGERQSPLDRLRDGPFIQSGPEISRSLLRLGEVHSLVQELPKIDHIPPSKITALWKFASVARAQAVARLPEERHTATLLAFIHTLEASAADDVIDVFDAVSTPMFSGAEATAKQARLGLLRDFDDAALKLRDMGIVVFDDATPDEQVRATIFELLGRDALLAAVERVGMLVEPQDETYFKELRKFHRKIRYVPALLAGLELDAAPAGRPLLDAVEYLRAVHAGVKRPGPLPTAFAPADWLPQIKTDEGSIDLTGYRPCVLDGLRRGFRRRDVFPVRSIRYADPRKGLLTGVAWETARPMICRTWVCRLRQKRTCRSDAPSRSRLPRDRRSGMDAALNQIRAEGYEALPEDVARLSPLSFKHINMLGRYAFTLPDAVTRGELRPLRNPATAAMDEM